MASKRIHRSKTLADFAKFYGVSLAKVKRAVADGLDIDDEAQARAHFHTFKPAPVIDESTAPEIPRGKLGLSYSTQRLQEAESDAYAAYQKALAVKDNGKAALLLKQWVLLGESLRKAEMASPDVAEQNKKSISTDDLELTLSKTFTAFRQELENLPVRIASELVGRDVIAIREILSKEVGDIITALYKCQWLAGDAE